MSSNYSVTRDQIIMSALRKLGQVEPSDTSSTIDADIITNAAQTLNLMIKQWAMDGIKMWTIVELTLPLQASKTTYTIGPSGYDLAADKPLKLVQAWMRNTQSTPDIDIPLMILSKQQYNVLGSKFSTGVTNSIYLDPNVLYSTVYLYLTPDTNAVSTFEVHMVVQRPLLDISSGTATPDFPNEWMNALVWGLADQMAIEFDVPMNHRQEIMAKAEKYREQASSFAVEAESTLFVPDSRNYGYSQYI